MNQENLQDAPADFQTMQYPQCFKQWHNCCGHYVSPQQTALKNIFI
jgi:hypothetical protein